MKGNVPFIKAAAVILALNVHCAGRAAEDCSPNTIITISEMKKNGWAPFHGVVTALDTRAGAFAIKMNDKQYAVYVTGGTIICNRGKPGKLGDARIGDQIGGIAKLTNGKSVAVRVGIGAASEIHPYGIPVTGKTDLVESPYAKGKYISVKGFKRGDVIKDPNTQKLLLVP
jgi:hypothetical protein